MTTISLQGNTQLTYSLLVPDSIMANDGFTMKLIASNPGAPVVCKSITIAFPEGALSTDLMAGGAAISTQPQSGWSFEVKGAAVTFTAPNAGVRVGQALAFSVDTFANATPGTAEVTLTETCIDGQGGSQQGTGVFCLTKLNPPLLAYQLEVEPDPLWAGNSATLSLTASNAGDDAITCQSIQLTLPVGTDATDLIAGIDGISTEQPLGWTAQVDKGGVVTFRAPAGGAAIMQTSLRFALSISVNDELGTSSLALCEAASDDGSASQTGFRSFELDKFPAGFSLSDLQTVPFDKTDVDYDTPARLNWSATGAGVSCLLEYKPSDDDNRTVRVTVPNTPAGGSYTTENLTRERQVDFTLSALVRVLGRDDPLIRQARCPVTVDTLPVPTIWAEPTQTGLNGLVRLRWNAPNADHCLFGDGTRLEPSGQRYILMTKTKSLYITAVAPDGRTKQNFANVTVDPSIQATEAGHVATGAPGEAGRDTEINPFSARIYPGTPGTNGGDVNLTLSLPPLDTTGSAARVTPVTVTGGTGGAGGNALGFTQPSGLNGGAGGNVVVNLNFDPLLGPPAQYLIVIKGGPGGTGGQVGGNEGAAGWAYAYVEGQCLDLARGGLSTLPAPAPPPSPPPNPAPGPDSDPWDDPDGF